MIRQQANDDPVLCVVIQEGNTQKILGIVVTAAHCGIVSAGQPRLAEPMHLADDVGVPQPVERVFIFPGPGAGPDYAVQELLVLSREL